MDIVMGDQYGNCYNSANISGDGYDVGGICGFIISGTIQNCKNDGTVNGGYRTGGICGYALSNVELWNCTNSAEVSEGGIILTNR